jgi:hypothetical protein
MPGLAGLNDALEGVGLRSVRILALLVVRVVADGRLDSVDCQRTMCTSAAQRGRVGTACKLS